MNYSYMHSLQKSHSQLMAQFDAAARRLILTNLSPYWGSVPNNGCSTLLNHIKWSRNQH